MRGIVSLLLVVAVSAPTAATHTIGQGKGKPTAPASVAMGNADVLKMVKAGLSDTVIAAAIRKASRTKFRLDPDALIALKSSGASDAVIAAMLDPSSAPLPAPASASTPALPPQPAPTKPAAAAEAPREAGIYIASSEDNEAALVPLEPTVFSQGKTGSFFTSAITYGIKKAKWKAVVRSPAANLRIAITTPVFYFHFEQTGPGLSQTGGFAGWLSGASSPNEFVLAKMTAKSRERELIVGEFGLFGSSSGTRSKDTVDFKVDRIKPGVYKVTPTAPLEPGEYCFFYAAGASSIGAGTVGKLFDFGVDGRVPKSQ